MPKIGRALKRAVELKPQEEPDGRSRKGPTSALMNVNRRMIFQFLCQHPCSRVDSISSNTSLSRSSVTWHLGCLIDAGYVIMFLNNKKRTYCPSGLVPARNLRTYSILSEEECMKMYQAVIRNPGIDQGLLRDYMDVPASIIARCVKDLLEIDLITRVMDGRHARFFPTEKYLSIMKDERASCKEFIRSFMRRAADEHLNPELKDLKGSNTVIEMQILGQKERLEIPQRILSP